ncbi:MAG: hypothetical protein EXS03_00950 [Phycisphaerales bacterium]|nr:hypothetical protein [Phycisphaerales bacterium]
MTSMRRAFSLVELLLAVFILGIGIIGISALFPVGIVQQRQASDDIMGPIVADNAMAILRLKLDPKWFGGYEDFGQSDFVMLPTGVPSLALGITIPGDWRWKRPGSLFSDLGNTAVNELGAIDIFSGLYSSKQMGGSLGSAVNMSKAGNESPDGDAGGGAGAALYGLPYNRSLFDPQYSPFLPVDTHADTVPVVVVTQSERSYPQPGTAGQGFKKPAYYWDCMFRRFEGRVQVAIFVYRIVSGGESRPYTVAQGAVPINAATPPLPLSIIPAAPWTAGGFDGNPNTAIDNATVPGTAAAATGNPVDLTAEQSWQYPGQWIVDQYGTVHRGIGGRRNTREGPVTLTRPIPSHPALPSLFGFGANGSPTGLNTSIRAIWFLPGIDAAGVSIVPVYATVQEL